jgi:uncharacterized protein YfkK (UPF0435 family)
MTHKTKSNKTTRQLIQIELLNVLNSSILKPADVSKNTKRINSSKNIFNMIKKSKSYTNKFFQEKNKDNSSKQFYKKKMNNLSNHIMYKTLYNYKNAAGPMLYAPKKSIIRLMRN